GKRADRRLGAWLADKPPPCIDGLVGGLRAFLGSDPVAPVALRDARPGDVGRIIARHAEIYGDEYGYPPSFEAYVVEAFAAFPAVFSPPRDRSLAAERAGAAIGSVAQKGLPRRTTQLRFLLLEREARGLGVGRRLVEAVIERAR